MLPIKITGQAQKEIKFIFDKKGIPSGYGVRIGVRGAGCSGVSYVLGFDEPDQGDEKYEVDGIAVLIAKKDLMYLLGITLDFVEDSEIRGFVFK